MAAKGWRTEDWVAVYMGFFIIAVILAACANRMKAALDKGERKGIDKAAAELSKAGGRNTVPGALGSEIRGHAAASADKVFAGENLLKVLYLGIAGLVLGAVGFALIGGNVGAFMIGFPVVFILAWLARVIAGNGLFIDYGVEYVIFALLMGLLISNTIGTPAWLRPAVQTEFFIKTGLVILGAGLLFMEVIQAGALGLVQAVLVVFVVWYACMWLCRKLRVDDEFGAMLSTAVSICGVSAAIAACGAIQGDKKKLSYVTSLVLIIAVPMMVLMPWAAKAFDIPDVVAGSWLGGTLDTSGSVVAAGGLFKEGGLKAGGPVKFFPNMLIGAGGFLFFFL